MAKLPVEEFLPHSLIPSFLHCLPLMREVVIQY